MSRRLITYKIAVKIDDEHPATLIVTRDTKTSEAALWLSSAFLHPCAVKLTPKAHADLLQALAFPPAIDSPATVTRVRYTLCRTSAKKDFPSYALKPLRNRPSKGGRS
jgi:hypothetical protein